MVKRRNAANSAWIVDSTIDEAFVLSRSSNTILDVSDWGKTIRATSTFTQTFDAAATLGDGWWVRYINEGTGLITLDPNLSETIDGATTLILYPGDSATIVCNGSNLKTLGRPSGVIVRRKTADEGVTSSTTLQDDDHLTFPIAANEEWVARIAVDVGSATLGVTGVKAAITTPAGATLNVCGLMMHELGSSFTTRSTASGGALTWNAASIPDAVANAQVLLEIWVLNGANAGNVTLQFAQETSNGTALTFRKGSSLIAHRVT